MEPVTDKRTARARGIIHAALEVFSLKGYAATSMEQIAARAGIGKSTLYEYFKTKEELFTATIMEAAGQWTADLEAVGRQSPDPIDRLRLIAALYVDRKELELKKESQLFFDVLSQTHMEGGVFFHQRHLIRQIHQRMVRIVVDYLLAGVSRGQLRPAIARDAEGIAVNFLAYMDGIMMHGLIDDGFMDIRSQVDMFMACLMPVLTAPEEPEMLQTA
jgi:TetR/AcrR family fatty acid metabolism transcriptional regulator